MKKNLFKDAKEMKKALKISATAIVGALMMSAGGCVLAMMNDGDRNTQEPSEKVARISVEGTTERLAGEDQAMSDDDFPETVNGKNSTSKTIAEVEPNVRATDEALQEIPDEVKGKIHDGVLWDENLSFEQLSRVFGWLKEDSSLTRIDLCDSKLGDEEARELA